MIILELIAVMLALIGITTADTIIQEVTGKKPLATARIVKFVRIPAFAIGILFTLYMGFPSIQSGIAELLAPHIPDRVTIRFANMHAAWTILHGSYLNNNVAERQLLANDVADIAPDVNSLSPTQKKEFDDAQDFVTAWQQNTRGGWEDVITKHPFDEVTPLAEYERGRIAVPSAPIQFPQGWSRSASAISEEVILLADQAKDFAEKGDCESSERAMTQLNHVMSKYNINIALGKKHSKVELAEQKGVMLAMQARNRCEARNSAFDLIVPK